MLRWGLLGTARINRLLIPAIRASGRSEVVAVASRDAQRAQAYAREWAIPRTTTYDGLLAAPDLDVVYLPLPNSLHAEWTVRTVAAGKHVLCEKPLAIAVAEVDRIAAAAAAAGRVVTEGFMYRHHPQTAVVRGLIESGAIGTLRVVDSAFTFMLQRDGDVRLDPALGGGCLWDVGCYPVSLAQHLAGAPAARVQGRQQIGPTGVDEMFAGTIEYANGVICQFHTGFRAAYHTHLRLLGTGGAIVVERPFRPDPGGRVLLLRDGSEERVPVPESPVFADEVADMEDAALGLRPPRISLDESRRHVATLAALYRSAAEERAGTL